MTAHAAITAQGFTTDQLTTHYTKLFDQAEQQRLSCPNLESYWRDPAPYDQRVTDMRALSNRMINEGMGPLNAKQARMWAEQGEE